jgi:hypothetical protein
MWREKVSVLQTSFLPATHTRHTALEVPGKPREMGITWPLSHSKPVFGSCEERTRESVWDRLADHIRASGQTAALKGRIHDRTRTLR